MDILKQIVDYINAYESVDIRDQDRARPKTYLRAIYFKIATECTSQSIKDIAGEVNRSRTQVEHYNENIYPQVSRHEPRLMHLMMDIINIFFPNTKKSMI